jgi:RHS repeat-associated protein
VVAAAADAPVRSRQTYEQYDAYGNVLSFLDEGDVGDPDDDYRATVTYEGSDAAFRLYSVSRPTSVLAKDVRHDRVLRKREAAYDDGTSGNLKTLTAHVDDRGTTSASELQWFPNGNLHVLAGPLDASGKRYTLTYDYDSTTQTYIRRIEDSHQYVSTSKHDVRFGVTTETVDVNRNATRSELDAFGRLWKFYGPDDPATPLMTVEYATGAPVPFARTRNRQPDGRTIDTVVLVDGLRRSIQTKKTAEIWTGQGMTTAVGWSVSGQQLFDATGRVAAQGQTFFEDGDAPGFVTSQPRNPTRFEYDVLGRTKTTTEANGAVTSMGYGFGALAAEPVRLQATATDALGNVRKMYRDAADRVVAVTELTRSSEPTTRYLYDPLGQLTSIVDAIGSTTSLSYDLLGRRTSIDSPDAGRVDLTFDAAGNLIEKVDANLRAANAKITYVYDYDHLVTIKYPASAPVSYVYGRTGAPENGAGRIVRVEDDAGVETHGYGKLGELVRMTRTVRPLVPNGAPRTFETRFSYDPYGRMRTLVYPDGETLTYTYDAGGLLASATGDRPVTKTRPHETETYLRTLAYDEFGQRRLMVLGNGATSTWGYDLLTRRLHTLTTRSRDITLQAITYDYDLVGNVTSMVNALGNPTGPLAGSVSYAFGYDQLYRLTSASGAVESRPGVIDRFASAYDYSDIHNMTANRQIRRIGVGTGQGTDTETPAHSNHDFTYVYGGTGPHQATQIGDTLLGYDANGNTAWECRGKNHGQGGIAPAGWGSSHDGRIPRCGPHAQHERLFSWDEENRVTAVIDGPGANTTRFLYDASGERVVKLGQAGPAITIGQFYAVKGKRAASKHVFAGSTRLASKITWTPELDPTEPASSTATVANCTGATCTASGPVAASVATQADAFRTATYYYHADHLGSTGWMTDETGRVEERVEYYPYGEVWRDWRQQSGEPHLAQRFLFTAKEYDEETGLYYFGARYYDAKLCRWASSDPMLGKYLPTGDPDTDGGLPGLGGIYNARNLSLYAYAHHGPITYKDPDGLLTIIVHGTFASNADYARPGADFQRAVTATFKEEAVAFNWSGSNTREARADAARALGAYIQSHLKEGEKLNIVAHSHGGNVVKAYTRLPGSKKIDVLVNLGTPQRDDYTIDPNLVGRYVNVYSEHDNVQVIGGYTDTKIPFTNKTVHTEAGSAGRTDPTTQTYSFPGSTNLQVSTTTDPRTGKSSNVGHSDLHTRAVWQSVEGEVTGK